MTREVSIRYRDFSEQSMKLDAGDINDGEDQDPSDSTPI